MSVKKIDMTVNEWARLVEFVSDSLEKYPGMCRIELVAEPAGGIGQHLEVRLSNEHERGVWAVISDVSEW
jgi:hypothetical protein